MAEQKTIRLDRDNNVYKFVDDDDEDYDPVKDIQRRKEDSLADLRLKQVAEINVMKQGIIQDGVAIGISPPDSILDKYTRKEITDLIRVFFKRVRARGSDGRIVPIAPLALDLVGEYSPKHRWHYHGIIKVSNIVVLDSIKARCRKLFGRTITEQINNTSNYINYMFKQYECPEHFLFYPWVKEECYIHIDK